MGSLQIIVLLLNFCNICRIFAAELQMIGEYFGRRFLSHITPFFDTGYVTKNLREEKEIAPERWGSLQLPAAPLNDYLTLTAKPK